MKPNLPRMNFSTAHVTLCLKRGISCASISLLLATTSLLSSFAYADGEVFVTIVDARTQRPVEGAHVKLTARDGSTVIMLSNEKGIARQPAIDGGLYDVEVSREGYSRTRITSVRIIDDKSTPLRIELSEVSTDLEETLVIGNARAVDPLSSAGASYFNREDLRSAVGSGSDVLRALDGMPGLFSSGEFSSFTVRGNGPKDNLILVDGIPYDNVVHFGEAFGEPEDIEGGGRFSVFAPNVISGAEFQPGGWNSAYGGKSGSLLQLDVAEGNPITPSYTLRLDLAGLEVGYDGPSPIHDDTSLLFSARRLDFGNLFEAVGIEDIGSPVITDIILKTTTELNDDHTLNFLTIYAPEKYDRTLENALASDEDDPGNWEDLELTSTETDNALYAMTLKSLVGDESEWINQIYYRIFDEHVSLGEAYPDLAPSGTPINEIPVRENILSSRRDESEIGLQSNFISLNHFGQLHTGLRINSTDLDYQLQLNDDEWIQYIYDQDDFRPDPDQRFIVLTPDNINNTYEESATNYAMFLDQSFEFDEWDFRVGARLDRDDLSDENLVSPRAGSNWNISNEWRVSATAGVYYQAPSFTDRASDAGNADLENEKVTQFSLGFKYYPNSDYEILFEPYYQKLDNLVVANDAVTQAASNNGEGESVGIDFAVIRQFSDNWSAIFNYSYNDATLKDGPNEVSYDADFSRPHYVALGGVWEINEKWKLSSRWKWASGAPRDDFFVNENVLGDGEPLRFSKEITSTNSDRYQGFSSLNFRADYRTSWGSTDIIAFIDIINVLGSANPSSADFNERTGEDSVEDGEVFPQLGFRLEW